MGVFGFQVDWVCAGLLIAIPSLLMPCMDLLISYVDTHLLDYTVILGMQQALAEVAPSSYASVSSHLPSKYD